MIAVATGRVVVVAGLMIRVCVLEARRGGDGGYVTRQRLWIGWIERYGGDDAHVGRGGDDRRGRVDVENSTEGHVWSGKGGMGMAAVARGRTRRLCDLVGRRSSKLDSSSAVLGSEDCGLFARRWTGETKEDEDGRGGGGGGEGWKWNF